MVSSVNKKPIQEKGLILGAAIGNCVHVAGVCHFLDLARNEGYRPVFLGPAIELVSLFESIDSLKPSIVAIGYRLTPENVTVLFDELKQNIAKFKQIKWVFGGTKPVADIARHYDFFNFISDGYDDVGDCLRFLRSVNMSKRNVKTGYGKNLLDRIKDSYPYPIIRHHYGRPSMKETIDGIAAIAGAKVLDVISLGPDQNAQEFFFRREKMRPDYDGAGGVPIRMADDLRRLKCASQCGNYPLMRCYSGTNDIFSYAKMLIDTIDNAWAAIPLCWYNELDSRGPRTLEISMDEAKRLIAWHAEQGLPVEINEPHHWGLRDAHDVIPVTMAYIAAYNAKNLGVEHYVAQYMFNNPSGLSFSMDLAKIIAMMEMVESLEDDGFHTYRETRAGLTLFNGDPNIAKGQLAASIFMQTMIKPHIMHVVGYTEANHAAKSAEVIESCRIAKGVIRHLLNDNLSVINDESILKRKDEIIREAMQLLDFIKVEYSEYNDPLTNTYVLCDSIKQGYLDAVHIVKNDKFCGELKTRLIEGKCLAVNELGIPISEEERLMQLKARNTKLFKEKEKR